MSNQLWSASIAGDLLRSRDFERPATAEASAAAAGEGGQVSNAIAMNASTALSAGGPSSSSSSL